MPNGKTPAVPPAGVEITIIADFPNPTRGGGAAEVSRMEVKPSIWEPSTDDFTVVANTHRQSTKRIFQIKTLGEFIGALNEFPDGGVQRVNLITHANGDIIALRGSISATSKTVTLGQFKPHNPNGKPPTKPIDSEGFEFNTFTWLETDPEGKAFRNLARAKFRSDAEIVIIACHTGVGIGLLRLQDMAKVFHVAVKGFRDSIGYCPTFDPLTKRVLDRNLTRVGACDENIPRPEKAGFKHLTPDQPVRKPSFPSP